ncbi:MAG: glycosyltransferase family 2 protein [Salegentibacter mishustinae]|nr:glycosyltransferase family 2 protein [Salegentibacter mishustinae]
MAKAPLISIITVNLNNLEGLKKTMTSVFEQTWQEFEYIVIDGGSTDGSKEYIEQHTDKLNYWVSEQDKGIYNAMNKGILKAEGEYLLFLNSGDWLFDKKVLKIVQENIKNVDVLYGNMVKIYADGREHLDKGVNGRTISLKTFIEGTLNHSASFINHRLFSKYGLYDEGLYIVSDWKFFLISLGLNESEVIYVDFPVSYFDMNGISNKNLKLRNEERELVINDVVALPVFSDYLKLKQLEEKITSHRYKKFAQTDEGGLSRKLHSLIFRIFS